jgi:hypothetical protein
MNFEDILKGFENNDWEKNWEEGMKEFPKPEEIKINQLFDFDLEDFVKEPESQVQTQKQIQVQTTPKLVQIIKPAPVTNKEKGKGKVTFADIVKNNNNNNTNNNWEDSNREPQTQQTQTQPQMQQQQITILRREPQTPSSSRNTEVIMVSKKQTAINFNKNNPKEFPLCENCNKKCFLSNHATKIVCIKSTLNYCNYCFNNHLEVLDEFENRRKCPNHERCIAFESKSDRKRWNNDDFEIDYFADPTKCPEHQDITLIGEYEKWCMICDADMEEVQLRKDENTANLYNAAMIVGVHFMRQKYPGELYYEGAIMDAFYKAKTRTQIKAEEDKKKNEKRIEEWRKKEEAAIKNFEQIMEKWVPEQCTFLRKKIEERKEQIIFEITRHEQEDQEPIICYGCLSVEPKNNIKVHKGWGPMCPRCRTHHEHQLFPDLPVTTIFPPPPEEWTEPEQSWTVLIIKRKKKSQGQRQREKQRLKLSNWGQ